MEKRTQKALEDDNIHCLGCDKFDESLLFKVKSSNPKQEKYYMTTIGKYLNCTCDDFRFSKVNCKHLVRINKKYFT